MGLAPAWATVLQRRRHRRPRPRPLAVPRGPSVGAVAEGSGVPTATGTSTGAPSSGRFLPFAVTIQAQRVHTRHVRTSTRNAAHRYRTGTKVQAMYHMTYLYRSEMALAPADKAVRRRALLRAAIGCEQPHHRHGGGDGSHRGAADEQSGACDLAPEAPRLWQA